MKLTIRIILALMLLCIFPLLYVLIACFSIFFAIAALAHWASNKHYKDQLLIAGIIWIAPITSLYHWVKTGEDKINI